MDARPSSAQEGLRHHPLLPAARDDQPDLAAVYSLRNARRFGETSFVFLLADALSIVVYASNAAVAIKPSLLETVGIGLKPLEVEGILIAILLSFGLLLAAVMFIRSATVTQEA